MAERDWGKKPASFEGSFFGRNPKGYRRANKNVAEIRKSLAKAQAGCRRGNSSDCARVAQLRKQLNQAAGPGGAPKKEIELEKHQRAKRGGKTSTYGPAIGFGKGARYSDPFKAKK